MSPRELKTAAKLAKHLSGLHAASVRLGFSPMVSGALINAAQLASTEVAQATCQHVRQAPTALNSARIRASVVVCLDCRKSLILEDV